MEMASAMVAWHQGISRNTTGVGPRGADKHTLGFDLLKWSSYTTRAPNLKSTGVVLASRLKITQIVIRPSYGGAAPIISVESFCSCASERARVVWQAASLQPPCQRRWNSAIDPSTPVPTLSGCALVILPVVQADWSGSNASPGNDCNDIYIPVCPRSIQERNILVSAKQNRSL
jgi:hypothetical protein